MQGGGPPYSKCQDKPSPPGHSLSLLLLLGGGGDDQDNDANSLHALNYNQFVLFRNAMATIAAMRATISPLAVGMLTHAQHSRI